VADVSGQQSLEALAKANHYRLRQADLHRRVDRGEIGVIQAMHEPVCENLPVYKVLQWEHRVGRQLAARYLQKAGISQSFKCGKLTDRQVRELARVLGERRRSW